MPYSTRRARCDSQSNDGDRRDGGRGPPNRCGDTRELFDGIADIAPAIVGVYAPDRWQQTLTQLAEFRDCSAQAQSLLSDCKITDMSDTRDPDNLERLVIRVRAEADSDTEHQVVRSIGNPLFAVAASSITTAPSAEFLFGNVLSANRLLDTIGGGTA